jgi:hypothetical protein
MMTSERSKHVAQHLCVLNNNENKCWYDSIYFLSLFCIYYCCVDGPIYAITYQYFIRMLMDMYRLCGLVVRVPAYRSIGGMTIMNSEENCMKRQVTLFLSVWKRRGTWSENSHCPSGVRSALPLPPGCKSDVTSLPFCTCSLGTSNVRHHD